MLDLEPASMVFQGRSGSSPVCRSDSRKEKGCTRTSIPRPRSDVATSRLRSLADDPDTSRSIRSVSRSRRTKRSHPGTT